MTGSDHSGFWPWPQACWTPDVTDLPPDPPRRRRVSARRLGVAVAFGPVKAGNSSGARAALHHALISYLFGAVNIAATVNLTAGLAH